MKVLWVGHFVPFPPRGGSSQRGFNLIREAAKSVEMHFVGTALAAQQPTAEAVEESRRALSESCASVSLLAVPWLSSRMGKASAAVRCLLSGRSYNEAWLDRPDIRRHFAEAIERVQPHALHVDSVQIGHMLPPRSRVPAALNHHNIETHMMRRRVLHARGAMRAFFRREARKLDQLQLSTGPRFARHLVCSALDAERLQQELPGAQCSVIPNGVDPSYFTPPETPEQPDTLVFAGRLNQYPNEQAMLRFINELMPALRERLPGLRLIVAGMNPTPPLVALAEGLSDVTLTGYVEDIRPWIAKGVVYVCPILDGGGTRLKLLDAMALERPVVATPMSMEGLDATDGEQAVFAEFGPAFVDAVVSLMADAERRRALARRAREWTVAQYAWESIGRRLVDAYRETAATTVAEPSGEANGPSAP